MADHPELSAVESLIVDTAPQGIADGVSRDSMLWNTISKRRANNAKGPQGQLLYDDISNATTFEVGGDFPEGDRADFVAWSMGYGNFVASIRLHDRPLREMSAAGPDAVFDYVAAQVRNASLVLVNKIDNSAVSGDGTSGAIVGLTNAISDTGTYADLSRTTYSEWACYVADNSGTPRSFSVALLDAVHRTFMTDIRKGAMAGNFSYKCGPDTFEKILATTATQQTQLLIGTDGLRPEQIASAFGVVRASHRGIPIDVVPNYTEGRIDLINMDAVFFAPILAPNGVQAPLNTPTLDAPFHILPAQRTNDAYQWDVVCYVALMLENPRFNAASLQDITYT